MWQISETKEKIMDINKYLVMLQGKDKTEKVEEYKFESNLVNIILCSNEWWQTLHVQFLLVLGVF